MNSFDVDRLSGEDRDVLKTLDSRCYGFLKLSEPESREKIGVVLKSVATLERELVSHYQLLPSSQKADCFWRFCQLGHIHLLLNNFDKAKSAYQWAHKLNKAQFIKDPVLLYGLALTYFYLGYLNESKETFLHLLYIDPSFNRSTEISLRLAHIYLQFGDLEKSVKYLRATVADNSACSVPRYLVEFQLASIYQRLNSYNQACQVYERVVRNEQSTVVARAFANLNLGWLYYTINQPQEAAVESLKSALNQGQGAHSGKAWYVLGRIYAKSAHIHDAFLAYRHSIDHKDAKTADIWCSIGVLYQQQSQTMDALQAYICAIQLDCKHGPAWMDLGILYENCKQFKDACICYHIALKPELGLDETVRQQLEQRVLHIDKELLALTPQQLQALPCTLPAIEQAWDMQIEADVGCSVPDRPQLDADMLTQAPKPITAADYHAAKRLKVNGVPMKANDSADVEAAAVAECKIAMETDTPDTDLLSRTLGRALVGAGDISSMLSGNELLPNLGTLEDDLIDQLVKGVSAPPAAHSAPDGGVSQPLANGHHELLHLLMTSADVMRLVKGTAEPAPLRLLTAAPEPSGLHADPLPAALHPATPSIHLESKRDAFSEELEKYCMSQPVVVMRGMAAVLKMDLGLYSTKSLVEANPSHQIEVRSQYYQSPDENVDSGGQATWFCDSNRSFSTIAKYSHYQATSFQQSLKEEQEKLKGAGSPSPSSSSGSSGPTAPSGAKAARAKDKNHLPDDNPSSRPTNGHSAPKKKRKMIKFGTNADLSDERKWLPQLQELNKLPNFLKVRWVGNILNYIAPILGVNTVQLYMKVPGCRTPGHQENNNFCSVNINIGPGNCEWFAVAEKYWGIVHRLCQRNNIDYLSGSWWPQVEDLLAEGVPVYRFLQRPGDVVFINSGTVHWVQAVGWCNNIAWNVGPMNAQQYQLAAERYEWNRLQRFKSVIPILTLSWSLARHVRVKDRALFESVRWVLLRSLHYYLSALEFVETHLRQTVHYHGRDKPDMPALYCNLCDAEVFNLIYVTQAAENRNRHLVHCLECARRASPTLDGFKVLKQFEMTELCAVYDKFLHEAYK